MLQIPKENKIWTPLKDKRAGFPDFGSASMQLGTSTDFTEDAKSHRQVLP